MDWQATWARLSRRDQALEVAGAQPGQRVNAGCVQPDGLIKLAVDLSRQGEVEWMAAVRAFQLAAREAGEVVTVTAKPMFLSPEQAGERIGVSRETIIDRINKGEINTVMVGTHRKIPLRSPEEYLRTRYTGDRRRVGWLP